MKHSCWTFLFTLLGGAWLAAAPLAVNGPVVCEGYYPQHLQGTASNGKDAFYWSWTVALVKTDLQGKILKSIPVATHHGDLCFHDGRVYVAVNLGKFNEPPGQEDSWAYVYDGDSLKELARHRVPELVHGAGGMAWRGGKFFVVGGLPPDGKENYIYEYDEKFIFQKRHVLASGYTYKGIQTIEFANGEWWFGCYGTPKVTLRADEKFQFKAKYEFDASLGIIGLADGRFLIGANVNTKGRGYQGTLLLARPDREKGLVRLN